MNGRPPRQIYECEGCGLRIRIGQHPMDGEHLDDGAGREVCGRFVRIGDADA